MNLTLNEQMDMGREAGLLKDSKAFAFALNYLRDDVYTRLRAVPLTDTPAVTLLVQQLKCVDALEASLVSLVEMGHNAEREWQDKKLRADSPVSRLVRRI